MEIIRKGAMTILDRFLQARRSNKAIPYIPEQSVILDIGCYHGELFIKLGKKLGYGVGIDPALEKDIIREKYQLLKDVFPCARAENKLYHCITMLAVLEHIPSDRQPDTIKACSNLLHNNGVVIVTVPNKKVDRILPVIHKLGLIHGMRFHEHYEFDILKVPGLFATAGFILVAHKRFQFGLNNLFVFKKAWS